MESFEKTFNTLSAYIDSGDKIDEALPSLQSLQQKVSLTRSNLTSGNDSAKQRLVLLEQNITNKITEANTLADSLHDELPNNPVGPST